ncbi:uncharacterized protein [Salminus brasiliensis]|uniref:uncharacterized protein n=1 Tax=Salminus brasiliensis TaxID=930266 RepID=UPI003B835FBF
MEGSCVEDGGVVVELHLLYDSEASCTKSVGTDLSMEDIGNLQAEVRELREAITSLEQQLKQQEELPYKEEVSSSEAGLNPVLEMEDGRSLTPHCYSDLSPEEAQGSGSIDQHPLQDVEEDGASMSTHCSVLKSGEPPPAAKRCSKCCSKFHCPFCPPTVYKPRHDAYSVNRHLQCHLRKAVRERGYVICMCHLGCRPSGHFHCPICGRTILRKDGAQSHVSSCGGGSERSPSEARVEKFLCGRCGETFRNKYALSFHLRIHTGQEPDASVQEIHTGEGVHCSVLKSGEPPPAAKRCSKCCSKFHCPFCPPTVYKPRHDAYSVNRHLQCHLRKAVRERGYVICMCHLGCRPSGHFHCPICGRTILRKDGAHSHVSSCQGNSENPSPEGHAEDGPHICSYCGKLLKTKHSLINHLRIHTGEKPHLCPQCGKQFSSQSSFLIHQRTHSGERPYACSVCGKGFKRKSDFSVHQRRHTGEKPYLCATCGKQLASRKTLSAHQKTHTGERPHHCLTCGKSFVLRSNLTAHRGTHTRLYHCTQCGRTFGRLDNLKVHQRTHAKQNP